MLFMEISLASICVEKQFNRSEGGGRSVCFGAINLMGCVTHRVSDHDTRGGSWNFIFRRTNICSKLLHIRNDIFSFLLFFFLLRKEKIVRSFSHRKYYIANLRDRLLVPTRSVISSLELKIGFVIVDTSKIF